jgi:hypothetical protein
MEIEGKIIEAIKNKDYYTAKEYIEQYLHYYLTKMPLKEALSRCKRLYATLDRMNVPSSLLIPIYLFLLKLRKLMAIIRIYKRL